jgi:hypothetical protein
MQTPADFVLPFVKIDDGMKHTIRGGIHLHVKARVGLPILLGELHNTNRGFPFTARWTPV